MKQEQYIFLAEKLKKYRWCLPVIRIAGKCLTCITAFLYMTELALLFWRKEYRAGMVLFLVPMITFFLITLFRAVYNQKRPYELYDIKPLIPKNTKGRSFPSRHVFSIYVIGVSLCFYHLQVGLVICIMGIFLAVLRVVTGVHFPKDVICGAILGILCGFLVKLV